MLILDPDHFSEWERASAAGNRFRSRIEPDKPAMALTIITIEEQMRGWLAEIGRQRDPHRQITGCTKLQQQVEVFADWVILSRDSDAAGLFGKLRHQGVRIGSMDLKIACIALAHSGTLLTRDSNDFARVPGLRFENWLD